MIADFFIRVLLLLGGAACVGCEMWGTYDFLWEKYGRWNYLVVGGLVLTSLAAMLPMGAEYAHRRGMRALKWAAWVAVPVALAFVFTVSIQRTGTATDNDETQRRQIAEAIKIAKTEQREAEDQLVTDKAAVKKNCDVWGPICTRAKEAQATTEAKLAGARAILKTHGVEVDDSMARRIVAYLPFLTREQVLLYQPLLLPMGLAIIGSLLIAIGARGSHAGVDRKAARSEVLAPAPRAFPSAPPKPRLIMSEASVPAGSVDDWVVDRVRPVAFARTAFLEAYVDYQTWCRPRGTPALLPDQFGERLAKICEGTDVVAETADDGTVFLVNVSLTNANAQRLGDMGRKTRSERARKP